MNCPNTECKGFLGEHWKCGLCETVVCSKCHVVKGEEHTCKEEDIATASLIKKDSKSCPNCKVLIHRIDGCDQMFCTSCHTAFNWKTGQIITSKIHNVHYFEWLRTTGGSGTIQRDENDIQCGGIPDYWNFITTMYPDYIAYVNTNGWRKQVDDPLINWISQFIMNALHIEDIALRKFSHAFTTDDNSKARHLFLKNEIKEEEFKMRLWRYEVKRQRKKDAHDILSMYITVAGDLLRNVLQDKDMKKFGTEIIRLQQYTTEQIDEVVKKHCVSDISGLKQVLWVKNFPFNELTRTLSYR